jgi:uncharacterized protein YdhG (YjbR/CyaY superfamily)
MQTNEQDPKDIDEYIAGFPNAVQEILQKLRLTIKEAAPDAEETISYKMPTFNLKGKYLVYFAAYKEHIGFYGAPRDNVEFNEELSLYEAGKGTRFATHGRHHAYTFHVEAPGGFTVELGS